MIRFRALFGRGNGTRSETPVGSRAKGPSQPAVKPGEFRSVRLIPGRVGCCAAAAAVTGKPLLMRDALRLPLPNCSMAERCGCTFLKRGDRRDEERRLIAMSDARRWFAGTERRLRDERRKPERKV